MLDYRVLVMREPGPEPWEEPVSIGLDYIHKLIGKNMPAETTTKYEVNFLQRYFDYLKSFLDEDPHRLFEISPMSLFNAMLPIPQMQLYVHDPLEDDWSGTYEPSNNFRVDFGFWTGTKLIAVEIDGNEPQGYARDIRRDRLLRRANVDVVHILNSELDIHGKKVILHLLSESIRWGWRDAPVPKYSPFWPPL